MPKPIIVTCAPTGGIHTPTMSPHLPVTPNEIARRRSRPPRRARQSSTCMPVTRDWCARSPARAFPGVHASDRRRPVMRSQRLDRRRARDDPRGAPTGRRSRPRPRWRRSTSGRSTSASSRCSRSTRVEARLGADVPRDDPRLRLQEHLRRPRVRRRRSSVRGTGLSSIRVLRPRPPVQPGLADRPGLARAAVLRADGVRCPRRGRCRPRQPACTCTRSPRSCSATATSGRCSRPDVTRCRSRPKPPCSAATCGSAWRTACSSVPGSSRLQRHQVRKIRAIVESLGYQSRHRSSPRTAGPQGGRPCRL